VRVDVEYQADVRVMRYAVYVNTFNAHEKGCRYIYVGETIKAFGELTLNNRLGNTASYRTTLNELLNDFRKRLRTAFTPRDHEYSAL
jgi:hypothetical protein